jgi:hypothetical protein
MGPLTYTSLAVVVLLVGLFVFRVNCQRVPRTVGLPTRAR